MVWLVIVGCVVIALIVFALIVLRFNQLSMARSLCDEAKRQLVGEIRARHALVPAFIGTLQQFSGHDLSTVELALASAERAPFGRRGAAAENALTRAIDDAARRPGALSEASLNSASARTPRAQLDEQIETTIQLLHGQLQVLTDRIRTGARFYNTNVERYHQQRLRPISRFFATVFKPREPFAEAAEDEEPMGEPERTRS